MDNPPSHDSQDPLALAREVAGDDALFFNELLHAFLTDASARVGAVAEANERGDVERAMSLLHSLKGSALSIGANAMAESAALAEDALRQGGVEAASNALANFHREFDTLTTIIRREMNS